MVYLDDSHTNPMFLISTKGVKRVTKPKFYTKSCAQTSVSSITLEGQNWNLQSIILVLYSGKINRGLFIRKVRLLVLFSTWYSVRVDSIIIDNIYEQSISCKIHIRELPGMVSWYSQILHKILCSNRCLQYYFRRVDLNYHPHSFFNNSR